MPNIIGADSAGNYEVTSSSTDTTAGRVTKVGDFGLGAEAFPILPVVDFNLVEASGSYLTPSAGLVNLPSGWAQTRYMLIQGAGANTTYAYQILMDAGLGITPTTNKIAWRRQRNPGIWSDWVQFYTTGTPNANGIYSNGNITVTRVSPHQFVDQRATGNSTVTIADSGSWQSGDTIKIMKSLESGLMTLTSASGGMFLPDNSNSTTHTIPAGTSMTITLTWSGTAWSLNIQG